MKKIFTLIALITLFYLVNPAIAQLSPAQNQYLKNRGAFINPGFEQGFKGWTITGDCTKTLVSEVPLLNKSIKFTCVSQSFSLKQNVDLSDFVPQTGVASLQVKSTVAGVTVKTLANDVEASSYDVPVGAFKSPKINIVSNASSNGLEISATSITGEVVIDDVNIDVSSTTLSTINDSDTDWISYAPTTQGFGTISGGEFEYKRVGDSLLIQAIFTVGATTATEAQISLPNSIAVKTGVSLRKAGVYFRNAVNVSHVGTILITGGDTFINFGAVAESSDHLATANGSAVATSGEKVSFNALIPIEGWQTGRTNVISQRSEFEHVEAYGNGGTFVDAAVTNIPFTTEVSDVNGSWNGSQFTAKKAGYYHISGKMVFTSSINTSVRVYINGSNINKHIGSFVTEPTTTFEGYAYLEVNDVLSLRINQNATLSNSQSDHHIDIRYDPNYADILGKIKESQIVNDVDDYTETEKAIGIWNGKIRYKRCFTVGTDVTATSSGYVTWVSGLQPVNSLCNPTNCRLYDIFDITFTNGFIVNYTKSTGDIDLIEKGTSTLAAGTTICMKYTK